MLNTNQMLSVKELNKVLDELRKGDELTSLGTFPEVDIVFVAGLFLWYKQQKSQKIKTKKDWICLKDNSGQKRDYIHSNYFKQIETLYKVSHKQIFENFPNPESVQGQYKTNIYSSVFTPPIYITEQNLDFLSKNVLHLCFIFVHYAKNRNVHSVQHIQFHCKP